eukprot:CAMPEP_0203020950 /NCGR_PEP_ID=MMETSP1401-20130829/26454_1 /ASSEMBLY_ACC=CAM_ASM_000894 /TAXON_ID=38833 /ORGANISM="Micromonas pusilla, Strain CCAC1681" /LENGTH=485 /DNA_ID=CAMNT_0049762709 /DNA_START=20 /DNA_END=1478 /DNA_ORIENTATION=-
MAPPLPDAWADLPVFEKDLYMEHPDVTARSEADARDFRAARGITVTDAPSRTGTSTPAPARSFEECSFPKYLHTQLLNAGFREPSPVQAQAWPLVLSGRNLVAVAATGSGKTLSYVLPAVVHVNAQPYLDAKKGDGPIVVVLAPTRELVTQIAAVFETYARSSKITVVSVYGGAPRTPQQRLLRERLCETVVATPGRLLDFVDAGDVSLRTRVTFLVVDEADRMLDLGFEPQIRRISEEIRPDRQTLMFTATWPRGVATAAAALAPDAATLRVAGAAAAKKRFFPHSKHNHESVYPHLPTGVRHVLELVQEKEKYTRLVSLLETRLESDYKKTARRVVVFFSSKARVDDATRSLRSDGFPALAMHGDKAQNEREWVLREFRTGTAPVLLATDVAARGLDVAGVATVINFDAPASAETFAHRVGRTGRRGGREDNDVNTENEETYTFLCPHARADAKVAGSFVATLRANGQEVSASVAAFASESEA